MTCVKIKIILFIVFLKSFAMTVFSSPNVDLFVQGSLILLMEVYLYFQELYSVMCVTTLFFIMAMGYRKARCGSRACLLVLGDIGRSPRMQYHALSLATEGFDVEIVGYGGRNAGQVEVLDNVGGKFSVSLIWHHPHLFIRLSVS